MCDFCNFQKDSDGFGLESMYTETFNHAAYFALESMSDENNDNVTLFCFQDKGGMSSNYWDGITICYCPMCGRKF